MKQNVCKTNICLKDRGCFCQVYFKSCFYKKWSMLQLVALFLLHSSLLTGVRTFFLKILHEEIVSVSNFIDLLSESKSTKSKLVQNVALRD